jgi:hypothetical protein
VLYPALTRDLLLTLAADGAFEPIWADEIIDEMRRNILANRPDIEASKLDANMIAAMNRALPNARLTGCVGHHVRKNAGRDAAWRATTNTYGLSVRSCV